MVFVLLVNFNATELLSVLLDTGKPPDWEALFLDHQFRYTPSGCLLQLESIDGSSEKTFDGNIVDSDVLDQENMPPRKWEKPGLDK